MSPTGARAVLQDVAYRVMRRFGCSEYILIRLMIKPLSHPETQALLLGAPYRLETRSDSAYMVVDQAVSAADELAGGVFKGLVNGVLRNYLRQRDALLTDLAVDESARYQHPRSESDTRIFANSRPEFLMRCGLCSSLAANSCMRPFRSLPKKMLHRSMPCCALR